MNGIKICDTSLESNILERGISFLNKYISDINVVGYTVFGSTPRGTSNIKSDMDIKLYFKYPADDLFLRESFKIDIPKDLFIKSSDSGFDVYQTKDISYEIKNVPLWHVSDESLLGSMKTNSIHDLIEILYGIPVNTFPQVHNNILDDVRDILLNKYIWSEKGLIRHGTGQTLSQIKHAEGLLTEKMENRDKIAKKITTSFYILGNIMSIIENRTWYRNFFQLVDNLPEMLIDMVSPMNRLGTFLKEQNNDRFGTKFINTLIENIRLLIDSIDFTEFNVLSNSDIEYNNTMINDIIIQFYRNDITWTNRENIKI